MVAAAAAATALVTVGTVASASAGTPATHSAAAAAATLGVGPAPQAHSAQAHTAQAHAQHATGHPAQAHPSRGAHLAVTVAHKTTRHQADHKATGHQAAHKSTRHQAAHKTTRHRAAHKTTQHRRTRPYRMYDSVTPSAIPAHEAAAVYSTGAYYATPGQIRHLGHALWIDTTGHNYSASVLDVEPGDATPSQAASWAFHRLRAHPHGKARIYTMRSQWAATRAAVHGLPGWMQKQVRWWIADPTGVPHIVPGAHATQWYWGSRYDLSLVKPGF